MKAWRCLITPGNKPSSHRRALRPLGLPGAVCIAALCLGAGLAQAAEEIIPPGPLPTVGERWEFHGRWMGIPIGYGWISVVEQTTIEGRDVLHLEAHGKTNGVLSKLYPIHDEVHSYIDAQTLEPVRFTKHQREGDYRAHEIVDFVSGEARYKSLINGNEKTVPLPEEFQDLLSAIFWLRRQPMRPGESLQVNLYTDEKIYPTELLVGPRELLEVLKRGTFWTVAVEPNDKQFKGLLVKRGRMWAYLSADTHRVPLLIKATTPWGAMSAVLAKSSIPAGVSRAATDRE